MDCREARHDIHPDLDRELDATTAKEMDTHLSACPACQRAYDEQKTVQAAIRKGATYYQAPEGLRSRVRSALPADAKLGAKRKGFPRGWLNFGAAGTHPAGESEADGGLRWGWLNFGAALAFAVAATWSLTLHYAVPAEADRLREEIVSAHVRSLMASHLADVASSDQHTVKPWFNGKLDFSPPVVDLTAEGFPLVGGRLDYLNHRPVAALAYRHRQHLINLFIWPVNSPEGAATQASSSQGYHILRWTHAGMTFWAVSDLNPAELAQFKDHVFAYGGQ